MKILAIVYTLGEIHVNRPEAEQFILMHKMGISVDIMCNKDSEYEQIFKDAGLKIVGNYPKSKNDKKAIQEIRELIIKENYVILHLLRRKSIACGIKAARDLPIKIVVYRGASGLYWHDPTAYENALNPHVDKVICVCERIKEDISKQLFFNKNKAVTIYKGHNHVWYDNVEKADLSNFKTPEKTIIVSCIAINRKWKGIPTLLDAIDLLPKKANIHVLLIGNGMDTRYYRTKISKTSIKIRFTP